MAAEEEAVQRMTVNRQKINSILIQLYRRNISISQNI